jgi:hypothetical protein
MNNYYKNQLNKLTDKTTVSIKLSDYSGNQTNTMDLNDESIPELIKFLESLKNINESES